MPLRFRDVAYRVGCDEMEITAGLVKQLREQTGVGMMECKKALVEAQGDLEAAVVLLRKAGKAKADKKSGRVAAEGVIVQVIDGSQALMLEVNCETDFVAKDAELRAFAEQVAHSMLAHNLIEVSAVAELRLQDGNTVAERREQLVAKLGENISLRRAVKIMAPAGGMVSGYLHGGRIGALVALDVNQPELGKDLAMQVTATNPAAIRASELDQAIIDREREIYLDQMRDSGKPAAILDKIIAGKLQKFTDEQTLEGQIFVKDTGKHVRELLQQYQANVLAMARFEVGEGIERQVVDFAAEVAAVTA